MLSTKTVTRTSDLAYYGRKIIQEVWFMKQKDTYKEVRTFTYDNAVVRVHIPDLTPAENERRMKEVTKAAILLLLSKKN
jgi:hypothetical protein